MPLWRYQRGLRELAHCGAWQVLGEGVDWCLSLTPAQVRWGYPSLAPTPAEAAWSPQAARLAGRGRGLAHQSHAGTGAVGDTSLTPPVDAAWARQAAGLAV